MGQPLSPYLALLRGINVGGKNLIVKDDLRKCFENIGYSSVLTYIQSGNVLFRSSRRSITRLTAEIKHGLTKTFSYQARVVVISRQGYRTMIQTAPPNWGRDDEQKHNAIFTLSGISPEEVMAQLPTPKVGIETTTLGPGVIFWSASKSHLAKTTMMKLAASPVYQQLTIRNHNTVFRLLELLETI